MDTLFYEFGYNVITVLCQGGDFLKIISPVFLIYHVRPELCIDFQRMRQRFNSRCVDCLHLFDQSKDISQVFCITSYSLIFYG